MMEFDFFDIQKITEDQFLVDFLELPLNLQFEVNRYKKLKDRMLKLYGLLTIKKNLSRHINFDWDHLMKNEFGKPFYLGAPNFNISHSGSIIVFVLSENEIGVDIELKKNIDVTLYLDFFDGAEKHFIKSSDNTQDSFYFMWTRKESFVKALGVGLNDELLKISSLDKIISYNNRMYSFKTHDFLEKYKLSICKELPAN
ncbi:4'-phosphopantetheinyl transferase family protein [Flammeovirga aprica]|uniref:4'-phosphopantetheinyl transferase superfamily protein n=1 Tax=Flammeovirga aprica JL-4 TaxID=694437 RepID=A0A7X9XAL0_9BACT|nr:4'-phosphopantetheinyl transferase superfamily protein [Flammeovirga aprica]NME69790.1 4'-phosphopantetheinyl transferase superfamily protein [Flammeovirga aprica JL-4]